MGFCQRPSTVLSQRLGTLHFVRCHNARWKTPRGVITKQRIRLPPFRYGRFSLSYAPTMTRMTILRKVSETALSYGRLAANPLFLWIGDADYLLFARVHIFDLTGGRKPLTCSFPSPVSAISVVGDRLIVGDEGGAVPRVAVCEHGARPRDCPLPRKGQYILSALWCECCGLRIVRPGAKHFEDIEALTLSHGSRLDTLRYRTRLGMIRLLRSHVPAVKKCFSSILLLG